MKVNSDTARDVKSYVERVERLQEERDNLSEDIADIYREAKSRGFNAKALRALVSERKKRDKNPTDYDANEADLDLYRAVLSGMVDVEAETPKPTEPDLPEKRAVDLPEQSADSLEGL